MTRTYRTLLVIALLAAPVFVLAQETLKDERGWSFSQRFQGSSNSAGVVLKTSSTAAYDFNSHVRAYAGFPIYFARESSPSGSTTFMNGLGNVYSGLLLRAGGSAIRYSSDLLTTFPTGDRTRGFSTGHPTIDWTNTFSHDFDRLTPYASIGVANTISDTSFFVRPFSSKGIVSHYEAGALLDVAPHVGIGGSAYGVRATGEQQVISKVVEQPVPTPAAPQQSTSSQQQPPLQAIPLGNITRNAGPTTAQTSSGKNTDRAPVIPVFTTQKETVGPAPIVNDHGFSSWVTVRPTRSTDLQIGYSRSMTYQFNSVFFGLGFRFGH